MKGETEKRADENEVKENKEFKHGEAASSGGVSPRGNSSTNNAASRQPFTQLSQLESDMVLARALQEQEHAYMILRRGSSFDYGGEDSDDGDDGSEAEPDVLLSGDADAAIDGSAFESDEAYARALQEAEDREATARMMASAGIHDAEDDEDEEEEDDDDDDEEEEEDEEEVTGRDEEEDGSEYSDEMWRDVDPDNMSYEELIALGEAVGTHTKGLEANVIAELPVTSYKGANSDSSGDSIQCVICRLEYEQGDFLLTLPCKHKYHSECVQQWLQINKMCPVCNAEVGSSDSK